MSALVAGSVTYTIQGRGIQVDDSGFKIANMKIAFGDSSLTYPTGGVPLSNLAHFGFPNLIDSLVLSDASNASGYVFKWDRANNKLLMYVSAAFTPAGNVTVASHTHDIKVIGSQATSTTNDVAVYTSLLGKQEAGNATISGSNSTLAGGVVATTATATLSGTAVAAAVLSELSSSVAPAALTLYALVRGY